MNTTTAAGMYKPQFAAADDIAISCDCDKCKHERLTAEYWEDIGDALVSYQSGRLDLAGFEHARFVIHTTYKEAIYGLEV